MKKEYHRRGNDTRVKFSAMPEITLVLNQEKFDALMGILLEQSANNPDATTLAREIAAQEILARQS